MTGKNNWINWIKGARIFACVFFVMGIIFAFIMAYSISGANNILALLAFAGSFIVIYLITASIMILTNIAHDIAEMKNELGGHDVFRHKKSN